MNDMMGKMSKMYEQVDGKWVPKTGAKEMEKEYHKYDSEVDHFQRIIDNLKKEEEEYMLKLRMKKSLVGSRLVFIDLAGSDYENVILNNLSVEERKESKQINMSLLSLKECIRGINAKKSHIPFRNSKLTMVLKRFLLQKESKVIMIANASPCTNQSNATLNTLKYTQLVVNKK